jgi:hypothetical protein
LGCWGQEFIIFCGKNPIGRSEWGVTEILRQKHQIGIGGNGRDRLREQEFGRRNRPARGWLSPGKKAKDLLAVFRAIGYILQRGLN